MITSYMNSSFTEVTYAYGYTLPTLLQSKHFPSFKQLICRFLSPLSISSHIENNLKKTKQKQTTFIMRAMLYVTGVSILCDVVVF